MLASILRIYGWTKRKTHSGACGVETRFGEEPLFERDPSSLLVRGNHLILYEFTREYRGAPAVGMARGAAGKREGENSLRVNAPFHFEKIAKTWSPCR